MKLSPMIKRFLLYFISISALPGFVFWLFYQSDIKSHEHLFESQETAHVNLQFKVVISHFQNVESDLTIISELHEFRQLAESHEDYSLTELEDDFLSISLRKGIYDQIRFIDKTGQEILRVNYNGGKPLLVPEYRLQNKAHRYYFKKTMNLNKQKVYVSPLDLNIEKGEVEKPFKPMIRFGTPIFNTQDEKQGVLILNFMAQFMIDSFKNSGRDSLGQNHLLNSDGYWLSSQSPEGEWGFMLEERKNKAFNNTFPDEWTTILEEETGQFSTDKGLFTFTTLYPIMETQRLKSGLDNAQRVSASRANAYLWKIVSFVPQETLYQALRKESKDMKNNLLMLYAFLVLLIGTSTFLLVKVSEQKRKAEEQMLGKQALLSTAEEISNIGSWEWDVSTDNVRWSDGLCRLHGIEPEDFDGTFDSAVSFIHPDDKEPVQAKTKEMLEKHQPRFFEYRIIRPDGKVRYMQGNNKLFCDSKANLTKIAGTVNDITEQKKAEEERKNFEEKVRQSQKLEALGTLAGGIAHDFNNILTGIIGYTEISIDSLPEDSEISKNLNQVLKSSERARDLVKQILTFSRQVEKELKPLELGSIVKEVLKLMESSLPATIKICSNIDKETGIIVADLTQMHQLIMNLCVNAEYAMREKGGVLEINLDSVNVDADFASIHTNLKEGLHIKLTVRDTGHGMDKKITEQVFDPFFSTKKTGEATGMGLTIVHGIVLSHGGEITINSKPGKGTTFEVYLPKADADIEKENLKTQPIPRGSERILLVDDEKTVLNMEQKMLENLGYDVVAKGNSLETLETFKADPKRFDIVITDQTMPHMTGDALAIELMRVRHDIPVILCTGFSHSMTKEKAEAIGIRKFIMKPFVASDMAVAICEALEKEQNQSLSLP